jgi:dolichol-phosphate mannosyltransferase
VAVILRIAAVSPLRQLIRFTAVGGSGIIVNLGVLALLANFTELKLILASAIAIEVSILTNFLLHNRFTFQDSIEAVAGSVASNAERSQTSQDFLSKLASFNAASLGTAAVSLAVFTLLHAVFGMHYLVAQLLGIISAFALNYQISSRLIWKPQTRD